MLPSVDFRSPLINYLIRVLGKCSEGPFISRSIITVRISPRSVGYPLIRQGTKSLTIVALTTNSILPQTISVRELHIFKTVSHPPGSNPVTVP